MKIILGITFAGGGIMLGVVSLTIGSFQNTITGAPVRWIFLPIAAGLLILTSYYLLREEKGE